MKYQAAKGFSMIEILITLVLMGVGLLGMIALQSRTIQYTQDAVQHNTATTLANDLVELIRAMPEGLPASSGFFKAANSAFPSTPASCTPLPDNAAGQLACWAAKAGNALPGAANLLISEFYICRTATANSCSGDGSMVEIQIAWQARGGECPSADGAEQSICRYRLRTQI